MNKSIIFFCIGGLLLSSCGGDKYPSPRPEALVTLNRPAPVVHIAELPLTGGVKSEASGPIRLRVTVGDEVQETSAQNGVFSLKVRLKAGENRIEVRPVDGGAPATASVFFGRSVAAGNSHSAALQNGKLYTWGRNNFGQTGLGRVTAAKDEAHPWSPVLIKTPVKFAAIAFGQHNSAAIGENGLLYTWGDDQHGQAGRGSSPADGCKNPCRLSIAPAENIADVVQVSAGHEHLLALDKRGRVWAWGRGTRGQLGHGATEASVAVPREVNFAAGIRLVGVQASGNSSYAIDENGGLWAWGEGGYGNLGNGSEEKENPLPLKVDLPGKRVKQIATGRDHVLVLTESSEVYGWGLNANSQVGHLPDRKRPGPSDWPERVLSPRRLDEASALRPRWIAAGGNSSQLVGEDGKMYAWGTWGSMVNGKVSYENLPVPEARLNDVGALSEAAMGAMHSVARDAKGNVFAWGWSFEGSLGIGKTALSPWMYNIAERIELP